MGMGTARERGLFCFAGLFFRWLLGTSAQVKWSNQNGGWLAASLADGPAGQPGVQVCAQSTFIEGRSPAWESQAAEAPLSHTDVPGPCWPRVSLAASPSTGPHETSRAGVRVTSASPSGCFPP